MCLLCNSTWDLGLGYVFLKTCILKGQQQMIGEDIAAVTSPAQHEGLSEEQEDTSQSQGSTRPHATTHADKTKIILAVVFVALVIYLAASFYVAATQLSAAGLAVVGAVNALVVICTIICMCICVAGKEDRSLERISQDPILSTEEVSLGTIECDGPTVAENAPHQDLHNGGARPLTAASEVDTAHTSAPQPGPFIPAGDTNKKSPTTRPVTITTKAEITPPPAPRRFGSPKHSDIGPLAPQSSPLSFICKQTPAEQPVAATNAVDALPPLPPERSKSARKLGEHSPAQQHLPPLPEGVQLSSSSAQQHGASRIHIESKIKAGIDEPFTATLPLLPRHTRTGSLSDTKSPLAPQRFGSPKHPGASSIAQWPSTLASTSKKTPAAKPIVNMPDADLPADTASPLVSQSDPTSLASTDKPALAKKPVTAIGAASKLVPKCSKFARKLSAGLLPKHLGNSQQKSTLPTTPAGNTSKATTAKPADMAGASLLLSTTPPPVSQSSPSTLQSTSEKVPATQSITITTKATPPPAPRRSESLKYMGMSSLAQRSGIPAPTSKKTPATKPISVIDADLPADTTPPLVPQSGPASLASANKPAPAKKPVTMTSAGPSSAAKPPLTAQSSPASLASASKPVPTKKPVTMTSAGPASAAKPPLAAPRSFGSPGRMGVSSLAQQRRDVPQTHNASAIDKLLDIDELFAATLQQLSQKQTGTGPASATKPPLAAPRSFGSPRCMSVSSLAQRSGTPASTSKNTPVTAIGASSSSDTKPPLVPQSGQTSLASTDKPAPAKKPVTMTSAGPSSSTVPPLVPQSGLTSLASTDTTRPVTKPVTMISAGPSSSTVPPAAPKRSKAPENSGVGSSAQQHLLPLPEGAQFPLSSAQQHGAAKAHNEPKIDDLLGIDELFAAALQQTGDTESSTRELEHKPALHDQPQSSPWTTGRTMQLSVNAPKFKASNAHKSSLSFKAVASAVKRGTAGNLKTQLQSGVRKAQHGLLKKVAHATDALSKRAATKPSRYERLSPEITRPCSPAHSDVATPDDYSDTAAIIHYDGNQPHGAESSGTIADSLYPTNWEACSAATRVDEESSAADAQCQKAQVAGTPHNSDVASSATKPTTTLKKIKKKAASLGKTVTRAAYVAYIGAELAFGVHDAAPSKAYGFQLAPEIAAGGPQDVYLLIRGKKAHLFALAAISDVKTRNLWLCTGNLHTKRGHISISNLEFRIMSAGDERSFEYKSQYQIALKLIMPPFGAVPRLLTSAQHAFSISHSGKSRDIFLTTRVGTNSRTNIIKLVATSAPFKSYRKAFFYTYTESVIHAMVEHMNAAMRRELTHVNQQSLTICAALDIYAQQSHEGMQRTITDFFLRTPLGRAVYSDTALCIEYIGELIRFCSSLDNYPAHHALFWRLVIQEVWGDCRFLGNGAPRHLSRALEYDTEFVIDLHVICASVCKKQAITDREEVYSFIETLMHLHKSTSDSLGTRLVHYIALATVASPRLSKGLKAADIQHERWKKLLRTAEHTLKLYQLDAEASTIKALSKTSGAKHPCRINTVLLSDFTETTAYGIALQNDQKLQQLRNILGPDYAPHQLALAPESVAHIVDTHTHEKGGEFIPYAVFVSHLQDVYLRVAGEYYSQSVVPKLLSHWGKIREQNSHVLGAPKNEDARAAIRLLEAKISNVKWCTYDRAPAPLSPNTRLTSHTINYPFSDRTIERIGDAAFTGFLSVISVSPAMQRLHLLQPECSIHLDVARAIS
ncbi:hypothetical protein [Anaplasma marginale]|uniref:hypothetical protein n=1 Tax=Anaplasma marginale TaxID=770 RepID=UPI003977AD14